MIYFVHSIVLYIFIGVCKTLQPQISSMFEYAERVLYDSQEFLCSRNFLGTVFVPFSLILLLTVPIIPVLLSFV